MPIILYYMHPCTEEDVLKQDQNIWEQQLDGTEN